jgi:hypothetical protein
MKRNVVDLALLTVGLVGGMLAWKAGHERSRLEANYRRLAAAVGELPADDPALIYLKALDTGDPLHFAWRVHLPAKTRMDLRSGSGRSGLRGLISCSDPTDFIARVRLREDEPGHMSVYTKIMGGSSRSGIGSTGLARLLREHVQELMVEQVGKHGVVAIDPKAKKPTTLLRVALPESLGTKPAPGLDFPNLVELTIGPRGSLP